MQTETLMRIVNAVTDIGLLYSNVMDQLLQRLIEQLIDVLGLSSGAILLYDDTSEQLHVASVQVKTRSPSDPSLETLWEAPVWRATRHIATYTAQLGTTTRFPGMIDHSMRDADLSTTLQRLGAHELISVPLLAGGWITGVFQATVHGASVIRDADVQMLQVLARQMAVAIENARLFAQTRAEQERTRAVVDATNDAIVMLDEHWRAVVANRRARFFFGLNEHELIGRDFEHLQALFQYIFTDGTSFNHWITEQLRSPTARTVAEFQLLRPDVRLLQCFTAPVTDAHDRSMGRILVFRDITREREVEQMKNDFVATVSHELRTPLTSIRGALQLVLGQPHQGRRGIGGELPSRAQDLLTISLANTERLIRLISDILDIAKIEQGRIQLQRMSLCAADLVQAAINEVRAFADTRMIQLDSDMHSNLPPAFADRDRTVQILVNLLSNAIKFSSPGSRVEVTCFREGVMLRFTVQDWGRGIAVDDQQRLFQKFQQIDNSATRDTGGTGLGLSISKALVEEQGGRIWLESALGVGSQFHFTLPIAEPAGLGQTPETRRIGVVASEPTQREHILTALLGLDELVDVIPTLTPKAIAQANVHLLIVDVPTSESVEAALLGNLRSDPQMQALPLLILTDDPSATPRDALVVERSITSTRLGSTVLHLLERPQSLVLVVDDDQYVRPVLVRLLRRHGLRAIGVVDGLAALEHAAHHQPDLILLDIKMPGMNGYEVLRRLKEEASTAAIPVIFLTGNDPHDPKSSSAEAGWIAGYLEKPITADRLIGTITTVIGRNEQHDGSASS